MFIDVCPLGNNGAPVGVGELKLFGQDSTYRNVMIVIVRHLGEHLGQSIAYARMNGVVPPWTEEQQRQQQQQKPPEKPKP